VMGAHRFLHRVWALVHSLLPHLQGIRPYEGNGADLPAMLQELRRKVHQTIQKVTDDIEQRYHFNTAIAAVMELVNTFYLHLENSFSKAGSKVQVQGETQASDQEFDHITRAVWREGVEVIIKLLNPMAPHLAEELWESLGHPSSLMSEAWPEPRPEALVEPLLNLVIQVNGKVRSQLVVPASTPEDQIRESALKEPKIQKWLAGKKVERIVLARGRLVNIVTSP